MIGQTVSHYRIISQLGEGGMGVVYVAEDTLLGRRVAIKIPMHAPQASNYHARFLREARSVSALSHPHIATLYDYGETPDARPFIVMELVNGQDLGTLMRAGTLTLTRAVEIIEDVAAALGEAHRLGIIHRDVKPSNIMLNERGEVKVLDFGLAKLVEDDPDLVAFNPDAQTLAGMKTHSGVIIGTPLYLSPEQATGTPVDARSDLFALGALLYECVAGRPAFNGANLIEIAAQVLHVEPPPPSKFNARVPPELDRITLKALAKRPEDRYQQAEDFIRDLSAFRNAYALSDSASSERIARHADTHQRSALVTITEGLRRPRLSIAAVVAVIAILALAVWGIVQFMRPSLVKPPPEAIRAYDRGVDFLRENAYYQASKSLEHAIEIEDRFALAHARLAEALTELDDTDHAKDEMLKVSTLVPDQSALLALDALYLDAIRTTLAGDPQRAVKDYQQIAKLQADQPQAYVDLGRAYEKTDNAQKAIESYLTATKHDANYAAAYLHLGMLYARTQQPLSANSCFDRAEELYRAAANPEGRAEVLYQRGFFLYKLGKVQDARAALEPALKLAESTGNEFQHIRALLLLSAVAHAENNGAQAQEYAQQAIELAQTNGMENLHARSLVELGNVYLSKANYTEAENYLTQGLELARRYKARYAEALALINLGSLRYQQERPDEAVSNVNQALKFFQQGSYQKEIYQGYFILARAERMKGEYASALNHFNEVLQHAEQVSDQGQLAQVHGSIGIVLTIQEHYPDALKHFDMRLALAKSLAQQPSIIYAHLDRASALWPMGRYDEARAALQAASDLLAQPDGGNKALESAVHVIDAEAALSRQHWDEARTEAGRALNLAGTQYVEITIRAKRVQGLAQTGAGATAEGLRLCQDAFDQATHAGNPALIATTGLALAEAQLAANDANSALTTALKAEENLARAGSLASDWQAWLVAARAAARTSQTDNAHDYAARASSVLANLQQAWGTETYNSYLMRPDVQSDQKQLSNF
jgi:serine/threonine-protein kinase